MSNLEQKLSQLIQPGQRIYVAGSSNEPTGLLNAMAEVDLPENLEFIQFPLPGLNATDFTSWNATAASSIFGTGISIKGRLVSNR